MKPFETKSIIPIEGKTTCEFVDILKDEFARLRVEVLELMGRVENQYGTTDGIELEKLMSPKEWELYCLLNAIEMNLCV